ncbi:hypothetical protein KY290_021860 [Solanum tuberosum]|uniref:ABC-2 type transporter transmembrane domain-containing protein n=1 Tax=Solanum tuberosum TaxID=4113 RepID=A0ABQ7V2Q4_SOLTU|nr:hypothetical protein KY290_021860 [Solanum tuberosum]
MKTTVAIRSLVDFHGRSQYCYLPRTVLDSKDSQASLFMQSYTLTKWSFVNMSRDFVYYWLSVMICLMVSVCIGIIYINAGTNILPSRSLIFSVALIEIMQARCAFAAFIFEFLTFMSIGGFPPFMEYMKIFQRERMNGRYGVTAFVISSTLSAMPS